MKNIDTLKLGAAMLVMGPFFLLLDMVYILPPIDFLNIINFYSVFTFIYGLQTLGMYISVIGFLLLIKHHYKAAARDENIYRFIDYALALYIALEFLIIGLMFLPIPFADSTPWPHIGFFYWLNICRMTLTIGFTLFWAYGLFRGYGKMALLFSLCFFVLAQTPFIPYNNTEFFEQQDAYYEEQRAAMPEDYEVTYVKESELDLDEMTTDSENGVTTVVEKPIESRVFVPDNNVYLLILAYTWLRFSRQLFTKSQPQPEQEQPESA